MLDVADHTAQLQQCAAFTPHHFKENTPDPAVCRASRVPPGATDDAPPPHQEARDIPRKSFGRFDSDDGCLSRPKRQKSLRRSSVNVLNLLNKSAALCRLSEKLRTTSLPSKQQLQHQCNSSQFVSEYQSLLFDWPNSYRTYQDIAAWAKKVAIDTDKHEDGLVKSEKQNFCNVDFSSLIDERLTTSRQAGGLNPCAKSLSLKHLNDPRKPKWVRSGLGESGFRSGFDSEEVRRRADGKCSTGDHVRKQSFSELVDLRSEMVEAVSYFNGLSPDTADPRSFYGRPRPKLDPDIKIRSAYQQYYLRRQQRSRKFRFNLFMYTGLYKKQRKLEQEYAIYHNPLEGNDITDVRGGSRLGQIGSECDKYGI